MKPFLKSDVRSLMSSSKVRLSKMPVYWLWS